MSAVGIDLVDVMDKVVVDDWGQAGVGPFGALRRHVDEGRLTRANLHAELGQIVAGLRPGREDPAERILFWHRGLSLSDIALGALALDKAGRLGLGRVLPLRLSAAPRPTPAVLPATGQAEGSDADGPPPSSRFATRLREALRRRGFFDGETDDAARHAAVAGRGRGTPRRALGLKLTLSEQAPGQRPHRLAEGIPGLVTIVSQRRVTAPAGRKEWARTASTRTSA